MNDVKFISAFLKRHYIPYLAMFVLLDEAGLNLSLLNTAKVTFMNIGWLLTFLNHRILNTPDKTAASLPQV